VEKIANSNSLDQPAEAELTDRLSSGKTRFPSDFAGILNVSRGIMKSGDKQKDVLSRGAGINHGNS
jgi:hypothetical protein